tara:strand:- start:654 stop:1052 length:399 start_codon:yes stop_codon:yes gene_type:complete
MADKVKKVDRGVPSAERTQSFTQADAGAGDILKIENSLGKPAKHIVIENTAGAGSMTVRFNVIRTIYPNRTKEDYDCLYPEIYKNLALGQTVEDTTGALVTIGAGETFELDNDLPVKDIKLVAATSFDIFVC